MSNYFEEWGDYTLESFEKPIINKSEEKQLEERKLIEEADIQLSKELFQENILIEKKTVSPNLIKIDNSKDCKQKVFKTNVNKK